METPQVFLLAGSAENWYLDLLALSFVLLFVYAVHRATAKRSS